MKTYGFYKRKVWSLINLVPFCDHLYHFSKEMKIVLFLSLIAIL